ncbi:MAG: hypothetical protein ACRC12_05030 [Holosporales bacterium]
MKSVILIGSFLIGIWVFKAQAKESESKKETPNLGITPNLPHLNKVKSTGKTLEKKLVEPQDQEANLSMKVLPPLKKDHAQEVPSFNVKEKALLDLREAEKKLKIALNVKRLAEARNARMEDLILKKEKLMVKSMEKNNILKQEEKKVQKAKEDYKKVLRQVHSLSKEIDAASEGLKISIKKSNKAKKDLSKAEKALRELQKKGG